MGDELKLLACPFCGGDARLDQRVTQSLWNSSDAVFSHVACDECDIDGQDFCDDPDGSEAAEWWNTRAQLPSQPGAQVAEESSYGYPAAGSLCEARIPHHTADGRKMLWSEVEVLCHAMIKGCIYSWVKEPGADGGFYAPMMLSFRAIDAFLAGKDGKA